MTWARLSTGKFLPLYSSAVLSLASLAGWWAFRAAHAPPTCIDGHCPDPGTREYLAWWQAQIDAAPQMAAELFVAALILGGLMAWLVEATRRALWGGYRR
jgi:hypothetical protein